MSLIKLTHYSTRALHYFETRGGKSRVEISKFTGAKVNFRDPNRVLGKQECYFLYLNSFIR